ncbi:uncharacterized protein LOC133531295 [Cydia pomonella]|uniref:uncharacterized protein LOC133531295 n=1 Tax=Cydia pomonella TaxID=82600 RepID=UPI002ADDE6E4|nr:uncharacterized protein LOC133531295 [Cydia pomonella]
MISRRPYTAIAEIPEEQRPKLELKRKRDSSPPPPTAADTVPAASPRRQPSIRGKQKRRPPPPPAATTTPTPTPVLSIGGLQVVQRELYRLPSAAVQPPQPPTPPQPERQPTGEAPNKKTPAKTTTGPATPMAGPTPPATETSASYATITAAPTTDTTTTSTTGAPPAPPAQETAAKEEKKKKQRYPAIIVDVIPDWPRVLADIAVKVGRSPHTAPYRSGVRFNPEGPDDYRTIVNQLEELEKKGVHLEWNQY